MSGEVRTRLRNPVDFNNLLVAEALVHARLTAASIRIAEPLKAIGFQDHTVRWIVRTISEKQIQVWTDVTLAAMESKRDGFFRVSPQAQVNLRLYRADSRSFSLKTATAVLLNSSCAAALKL